MKRSPKQCVNPQQAKPHDATNSLVVVVSTVGVKPRRQQISKALPICDACLALTALRVELDDSEVRLKTSRLLTDVLAQGTAIAERDHLSEIVTDLTTARQIVNRDAARRRWSSKKKSSGRVPNPTEAVF